jgi:hypothetical protein
MARAITVTLSAPRSTATTLATTLATVVTPTTAVTTAATTESSLATTDSVAAGARVTPLRGSSSQGCESEDELCVHLDN